MSWKVFVYGTLKRGFYNHQTMKGTTSLGTGMTLDEFHLSVGGPFNIPYLQKPSDRSGQRIKGEVYVVDSEMLAILDRLEGVPHHYQRHSVSVQLPCNAESSSQVHCFIYVKTELDSELLATPGLESYTIQHHSRYIPPPMRRQDWNQPFKESRESFEENGEKDFDESIYQNSVLWTDLIQRVKNREEPIKVLEIGCGSKAPATTRLKPLIPQANFTLVDHSPKQLQRAVEHLTKNVGVDSSALDLKEVDLVEAGTVLPVGSFDVVICTQVLRYVPRLLLFHAVRTMFAVLNPSEKSLVLVDWEDCHDEDMMRFLEILDIKVVGSIKNNERRTTCVLCQIKPFAASNQLLECE